MKIVTRDDTQQLEIRFMGYKNLLWGYYGKLAAMHEGPQAFLADLPEKGATVEPHFHDVDQYQVIVRGGGRLGNGPAEPVVFHYADAYTPYGPIVSEADGIGFFTLRAGCASGHFSMPQSRKLMPGKPGRNIAGKFEMNKTLPRDGQSTRQKLIEEADGVEVVGLRLGSNAQALGEPPDAGIQYYVVCSGDVLQEGKNIPPLSLVLVEAGEPTPVFQAGPAGAELLMVQMPRPSERPGSDPKNLAWRKATTYVLPEGITGLT